MHIDRPALGDVPPRCQGDKTSISAKDSRGRQSVRTNTTDIQFVRISKKIDRVVSEHVDSNVLNIVQRNTSSVQDFQTEVCRAEEGDSIASRSNGTRSNEIIKGTRCGRDLA